VSQRVVQLEEALGAPLFERGHRGVTLTEDGARLLEAVRQALDTIRLATADIRARHTPRTLTLSTDFGFATYWLMPRLSQFKALMPDVDVKIVTSQNVFETSHDHADIAIAFGDARGDWGARDVVKLFAEEVTPVCSPSFLAGNPKPRTPADLAALALLHLQPTTPARWLSWDGWFAAHGLDSPPAHRGITFNSYAFVAHAAVMGEGVALGWAPLVDELVATGQLVRLFDAPVVTERGYLLVTQRTPSPTISAFRQWLLDECSME
jgi:putative choline sulfate-utilization transcription factor